MTAPIETTRAWYEKEYREQGFGAQRLYPNEELLRFLGRRCFPLSRAKRRRLKILETGCGSCSNLWMVAREGFQACGLDLSAEAIALGRRMMTRWGVQADLRVGSMTEMPYRARSFHVVVDVFSSYCLTYRESLEFFAEVSRVLAPSGRFFTYTPSTGSDAFKRFAPSTKLDPFTLDGIHRKNSPFSGNLYPFRFADPRVLKRDLRRVGLDVVYCERVTRTYRQTREMFEFLSLEAVKVRS